MQQKVIASYLITLLQFVSDFFKQLGVLLLSGNKEVERIDAQSDNCENQEDNEIAKTRGHKTVPLSLERIIIAEYPIQSNQG
jgi:hypothetical protein